VIAIKVATAIDAFNFQLRFAGAGCVRGGVSGGAWCEMKDVSGGAIGTTLGTKLIPVLLFVHSTETMKR
jgi:hypothetical protein